LLEGKYGLADKDPVSEIKAGFFIVNDELAKDFNGEF
jgi:hypothetical protein